MNEENIVNQNVEQEDLNELMKVRRAKLDELCEKGKNPFEIVKFDNKDNTKDIIDTINDGNLGTKPVLKYSTKIGTIKIKEIKKNQTT